MTYTRISAVALFILFTFTQCSKPVHEPLDRPMYDLMGKWKYEYSITGLGYAPADTAGITLLDFQYYNIDYYYRDTFFRSESFSLDYRTDQNSRQKKVCIIYDRPIGSSMLRESAFSIKDDTLRLYPLASDGKTFADVYSRFWP